jgi:hypothetical protein
VTDGKSFVSGTLRWLGFAADFAASFFEGAPIGITTPPSGGERSAPEQESEEEEGSAN